MGGRTNQLNHERLWAAIDAIATHNGLSVSALARRAGLNSTAFNKSKRVTSDGRPRWPSTESIAKILEATGADLADLVRLIAGEEAEAQATLPWVPYLSPGPPALAGFAEASGAPRGDAVRFPGRGEEALFAFEVGDDGAVPPYRPGDVLIASTAAACRKGDRVLVRTGDGQVTAHVLVARNARGATFAATPEAPAGLRLTASEVIWIARILWASQ